MATVELGDLGGDKKDNGDVAVPPIGMKMKAWSGDEKKDPLVVNVQFLITDILSVDSVAGSFRMNCDICLDWEDPGVCKKDEDGDWDFGVPVEEVWRPNIVILNALDKVENESELLEVQVAKATGRPIISQALTFNLEFRAPMDLRDFPFDFQRLPLRFISNIYTKDKMVFSCSQTRPKDIITSGVKLAEYDLRGIWFEEHDFAAAFMQRYTDAAAFDEVAMVLEVRRKPEYYITRIMSVIVFVLMMAGGVFFAAPEDFNDRFNLTLTLFLTAVAFHFVVGSELPKISYATRLDKFIGFMYLLLFATAIEHVVVARLSEDAGKKTDLSAIISFYSVLAIGSIWFLWPLKNRALEAAQPVEIKKRVVSAQEQDAEYKSGILAED